MRLHPTDTNYNDDRYTFLRSETIEGYRQFAYVDSVGVATIGVGFNMRKPGGHGTHRFRHDQACPGFGRSAPRPAAGSERPMQAHYRRHHPRLSGRYPPLSRHHHAPASPSAETVVRRPVCVPRTGRQADAKRPEIRGRGHYQDKNLTRRFMDDAASP